MTQAITSARLGNQDVASVILGQSPPSLAYNEVGDGLPFFQGKVDFGLIHPTPRVWCNAGRKFAMTGDILLSVRAPVGDVNVARDHCAIGRGIAAIRPGPLSDPWFLYFALLYAKPVLQSMATGSTFASVNRATLNDLAVPFLDKSEQAAIGVFLRSLIYQSEQEEQALHTAQALKRAAMHTIFTRGLRGEAQKETEVGPMPENWEVVPLEDCAVVQTGAAKGRKFGDAEVVQVPYLRVANVQDGYLDLAEMKTISIRRSELNRYRLQQGDVLMTEGGDFDKLGRGFIWRGQLKLCVHQNHVFAVRTDRNRLLPDFFAYEAQSDYGKAYFLKVAHKTTNLASINSTKLKAFPVLIPTLGEQREIVAIFDAIDRKIDLHRRKRAVLDELFKALLHTLMSGDLRVGELDLTGLSIDAASGSVRVKPIGART